MLVNHWL